jgi:hypothetical protein
LQCYQSLFWDCILDTVCTAVESFLPTILRTTIVASCSVAVPTVTGHSPSTRLQIDFHSHRLPTPAVYAASSRQNRSPVLSHPLQPVPSSPPTAVSGPSSAKASWSSILSAASYRNLLGGGGSTASVSASKRPKGVGSSDPKRTSIADEFALANGSISPEVGAAIAEIRRRRTANVEYAKTITDSPTPTSKSRTESMHSQSPPVRIGQSATLTSFRRRLPSLSQPVVHKVPLKPVKMQATFFDPPAEEVV